MEESALVFNIQRYSIHDGPGIRTIVFLKGCPLRCPWCANPEGMDSRPVLAYNARFCKNCGRCAQVCPEGAVSRAEDGVHLDRERCRLCGACVAACAHGAREIFGKSMSVTEVLREVKKDEAFFRRSGGGLTLSGGEPLASPGFTLALLERCREEGLDTAVESTLFAPPETVDGMLARADHILADIKLIDPARHREFTGADNALILENLRRAASSKVDLMLRLPLVPGVNDDEENLGALAEFIAGLGRRVPLEILPYHEFGRGKFLNIGLPWLMEDRNISPPEKEQIDSAEDFLRARGVEIVRT
ncbi:MAG: glycyl-radical enzyme activating protein [Spirochaetaceae bacterium]|nr:glycyl-radical enzyme activating protein [Spirochaetaceae bacterium]